MKYTDTYENNTMTKIVNILWSFGWLFTIGIAKLSFWQGVLAIFIWPYYLGSLLQW